MASNPNSNGSRAPQYPQRATGPNDIYNPGLSETGYRGRNNNASYTTGLVGRTVLNVVQWVPEFLTKSSDQPGYMNHYTKENMERMHPEWREAHSKQEKEARARVQAQREEEVENERKKQEALRKKFGGNTTYDR